MQREGWGLKTVHPFYRSTKWKQKRERVLRRDEYRCQECKRYGKSTAAATVHHINPLEQHPEWSLTSWNLVSLCNPCHDSMHDRVTGNLTEKGNRWVERVTPPTPLAD
ncbi:HNH endonuclease [Paenibacillus sp. TAB 01]|uniref:HNH endonuclease n=1 Tax=Paenibacillus sp. TAB 01 TaxID=3368988 RepID=UPI003750DB97